MLCRILAPMFRVLGSPSVPLEPAVLLRTFVKRKGGLRHLLLNVLEVQASALWQAGLSQSIAQPAMADHVAP